MIKILALSDTHINQTDQRLPDQVIEEASKVDMIFHTGDFTGKDAYDYINSLNKLVAVRGNMDDYYIGGILPIKHSLVIEGVRIGLIHSSGSYDQAVWRARSAFESVEMILFGHTHYPFNERIGDVLMFNPGSSTEPRNAPFPSFGIIEIDSGNFTSRIIPLL